MTSIKIPNVQIRNMTNARGNDVPNQFIIVTDEGSFFQSYSTMIAFQANDGTVYLDKSAWDYSVTTGRYRNQFLGEGVAETRKKIKSGEYKLTNLNG